MTSAKIFLRPSSLQVARPMLPDSLSQDRLSELEAYYKRKHGRGSDSGSNASRRSPSVAGSRTSTTVSSMASDISKYSLQQKHDDKVKRDTSIAAGHDRPKEKRQNTSRRDTSYAMGRYISSSQQEHFWTPYGAGSRRPAQEERWTGEFAYPDELTLSDSE
ncbi:hypothetical protein H072_11261 [Dactylellina haptotyla CBS 200.50]|uniref:Uncharacterized protein n=1 Tax=Dactylellina haptotyla (strain CBS 200.50) TaxID=1284197 RepID=S7ZY93_DACHA|nr:hypothetical protein H072_11261 [Dactylellina haptotyla CBS 200.50]